ncbi:condensation domain-containing protein [Sulfitobacter sabulilitoris]|uniref:Carrier domain-containing protein n=1 Tax=Sulfitobacter sabulilitoris TaxID=2562655 RepID=A0A5S3PBU6_9RHOB|nr:condensation domain-containing protein [Sulfitobacter sabulilitoris]TMM51057.1 hypothetical protein FDT80_14395 [Sulfitobacter sabulilitoris]
MKALQEGNVVASFPTSVTQQRCWFMEQIHPGNRGLNIAVRWELRGPATSEMVETAFRQIVARHEILRTCFMERDGEPVQQIVDHVDFRLNRVDVRNVPEAARAEKINEIARAHAEEPFDLGVPCLMRVAMIQIEPQRAALLIAVHNAVFDGYSIGVLGHELGTRLAALAAGTAPDLPDLELQYGDYAMWLAEYEASGAMAEEEAYWVRTLHGMPYFELPADHPRVAEEPETKACATDLPADFEERMAATAKALETSVFALGTAAFSIALERFSGRTDISFAVQVAGRNDIDLEPLIGIFTNPLVLRFDVDPRGSLARHAQASRDVVNGALAHQTLPFDKLVQVLNPPRDPLRIPLVSVMFNLQRAFLKERGYGPFELVSVQSHSPGTLYDLNVNIVGRNAGWRMVIDYNARLFDADTMRRFSDLLTKVFEAMMHRAETPIGDIAAPSAPAPAVLAASTALAEQPPDPTPRPETATRLRAIWADVLGLPETEVEGNFFDLGGHSALALRMLAKVGDQFDHRPGIYAFLGDPTLAGLARLLGQADFPKGQISAPAPQQERSAAQAIWQLIELRAARPDAPVLLTMNQPFMYQALARDMSAQCTVANLGVAGRDHLAALTDAGFDAALDAGLAVVRARYAGRPLLLCGLCVDGRVALRLAQRLKDSGEAVQLVAMIDTWAPGAIQAFSANARLRDRWRIRLRRLRYYLGLKAQGQIGWIDLLRQNDFAARLLPRSGQAAATTETEALVDDTVDLLVAQTRDYRFAPYDGEAALFITRSQGLVPRDGVLGWSGILASDTAVYPVNGWHGDVLMRSGFDRIIGVLDAKARRMVPADRRDD